VGLHGTDSPTRGFATSIWVGGGGGWKIKGQTTDQRAASQMIAVQFANQNGGFGPPFFSARRVI